MTVRCCGGRRGSSCWERAKQEVRRGNFDAIKLAGVVVEAAEEAAAAVCRLPAASGAIAEGDAIREEASIRLERGVKRKTEDGRGSSGEEDREKTERES